jgi:hypothetical protein
VSTTFDHDYNQLDLVGLEFLALAQSIEGDVTVGDATAVGEYASATAAALSVMQADATVFWLTGVTEPGSTTDVTGFSSTTPKDYFDSFRSDAAASGYWAGTGTNGQSWASSLRSAYNAGTAALKAQAVTNWTWLMTFTSNPAYETTATSPSAIAAAVTGTYDPKICLSTVVSTSNKYNDSSYYDWSCCGPMSVVQAAQDPASLRAAKEAVVVPQRRYDEPTPRSEQIDYVYLRGKSGLSYQVQFTDNGTRRYDCLAIASLMDVFRHQPQTFNLKDGSN